MAKRSKSTSRTKSYEGYKGLLSNPNVQRALASIRGAEGTARKADPYRVGFGFRNIGDLRDHPREYNAYGKTLTSAAGAYQALERTWDDVDRRIGLPNFGPEAQDVFAVAKIDDRGALGDVLAGNFDGFSRKVAKEWASFPSSPYGQPTVSRQQLKAYWDGAKIPASQAYLADERLANAWGPMDPNMTRGLLTPDNVPIPTPAPRDMAPPALNANSRVASAFDVTAQPNVPVPTSRPAYERARLDGQAVRYGTPAPQMASLPASVMDRMNAPAMPQGTPPASMMGRAPQGGLLSSFANGAANAVGGLLGAVTGLGTANAAVPPNAAAPMAPLSAPTPKGRRVGASGPLGPDQRVATAYDVALNTRFDPGPLPAVAPRPAPTVSPSVAARPAPAPATIAAPSRVATPTFASRPAPLSAPRAVGPSPAVAARAPVVADPWGAARSPTAGPVSPNLDNAAQFAQAPTRSATMKDVARGALLGGAVGGLPGMVAGGLLGGTIGPQVSGMFGGNRNAAAGNGVTTGLITGGAIPASVRANPERYGQGGFTGLGLPSTPRTPSQSQALKDRDRRGGRGDSGPAMSKSASDSIGKAGAGRGGLW